MQKGDFFTLDQKFTDTLREVDPNYIMQILRMNPVILMSWGAHAFRTFEYGLRITVSGVKHKGWVYIVLHGSDTFEIYLTTKTNVVTDVKTGIYFDQLVDVIDSAVEYTGASYQEDAARDTAAKMSSI